MNWTNCSCRFINENEVRNMLEIRTAEDLLNILTENSEEEAIFMNDIDFSEHGQITSEIFRSSITLTIDLNNHEIRNIYPVLCNFFRMNSGKLIIKNGYITNLLLATGHVLKTASYTENNASTYAATFAETDKFEIKFINIGFSILGCNYIFAASDAENSGICYYAPSTSSYVQTNFTFERCSFYIKSKNTIPLITGAVFRNCSFDFDCEYKSLEYKSSSYPASVTTHSVYYFCVIKGKIKKSADFERNDTNARKIMGELSNCYVDIETDIDSLFINVSPNAYPANLNSVLRNPESEITESYITNDTVYNVEKWIGEDGKNMMIGGRACTTVQMHDVDYLMECGFLAIDETGE